MNQFIPFDLVCPRTKLPLSLATRGNVERQLYPARCGSPEPFGVTADVLVTPDQQSAYPIVDGVPILLAPELLTASDKARSFNLDDPRYAEAYEEMRHYSAVAAAQESDLERTNAYSVLANCVRLADSERAAFPSPANRWLEATYDITAQEQVFRHIAPLSGTTAVQVGGKGTHALRFLLAGAQKAALVTPVLGEALLAVALARRLGLSERFQPIVGIFEELPIADASVDIVFSGGSLHHTITDMALAEAARILRSGGRFGCFDPWRSPFYKIGTSLLGKREPGVFCRPINAERLRYLSKCFAQVRVTRHGALTRYPLLALKKVGISFTDDDESGYSAFTHRLMSVDDFLASIFPPIRPLCSSVSICATKH